MPPDDQAEVLSKGVLSRFDAEVRAVLRRRGPAEAKVAGALRALSPYSPALRTRQAETAGVLLRRGAFDRELYAGAVRSLAECGDKRVKPLLKQALGTEHGGGLGTLSAACFSRDAELAPALARLAVSRHTDVAFAAEVARLARGEGSASLLTNLAAKIKESHRIALCVEVLVPLTRSAPLSPDIAPALAVLRDSERHLGRWLVMAEVAVRAGDPAPLAYALERAATGPESARAAWTMVAWALDPTGQVPSVRPTVELVARLSDRPSAGRDMTFLFRLALARVPCARPMLEGLARMKPLEDELGVRAAMHLVRDHGKADHLTPLLDAAHASKLPALRGVAVAALWDAGERSSAEALFDELSESRQLVSVSWCALLQLARQGVLAPTPVLGEPTFRRVQYGWVE